jgi:hypothetical protein
VEGGEKEVRGVEGKKRKDGIGKGKEGKGKTGSGGQGEREDGKEERVRWEKG